MKQSALRLGFFSDRATIGSTRIIATARSL
jgi:hypothetical protein